MWDEVKWVLVGLLKAFAAFIMVSCGACAAFTCSVRNSHDGQAGMGAAFGGIYAGVIAGVLTLVVSVRRDWAKKFGSSSKWRKY